MTEFKAANQSQPSLQHPGFDADFLAFRVLNAKRKQHEKEIRKIYNQRARLRPETVN